MVIVSHTPYSPDLAPCYFSLFPGMNKDLKWRRFVDVAEVQRESLTAPTAFPLKILDNVSSTGSGVEIAASSRRRSTSKGTKVSNL